MDDFRLDQVYIFRFLNDVKISVYAGSPDEARDKISETFGDDFVKFKILKNVYCRLYVNEFPYD